MSFIPTRAILSSYSGDKTTYNPAPTEPWQTVGDCDSRKPQASHARRSSTGLALVHFVNGAIQSSMRACKRRAYRNASLFLYPLRHSRSKCLFLTRRPFLPGRRSRFGPSSLHQRDPRSALFEGYNGGADSNRRPSPSPNRAAGGYGYPGGPASNHLGVQGSSYRPATPNKRCVCVASVSWEGMAGSGRNEG